MVVNVFFLPPPRTWKSQTQNASLGGVPSRQEAGCPPCASSAGRILAVALADVAGVRAHAGLGVGDNDHALQILSQLGYTMHAVTRDHIRPLSRGFLKKRKGLDNCLSRSAATPCGQQI